MRLQILDLVGQKKGKAGIIVGSGIKSVNHLAELQTVFQNKDKFAIIGAGDIDKLGTFPFQYRVLPMAQGINEVFKIENCYNRLLEHPEAVVVFPECYDHTPKQMVDKLLVNMSFAGFDQDHFGGNPCNDGDMPGGRKICCEKLEANRLSIQEVLQQVLGTMLPAYGRTGETDVHMLALAIILGLNPIYVTGLSGTPLISEDMQCLLVSAKKANPKIEILSLDDDQTISRWIPFADNYVNQMPIIITCEPNLQLTESEKEQIAARLHRKSQPITKSIDTELGGCGNDIESPYKAVQSTQINSTSEELTAPGPTSLPSDEQAPREEKSSPREDKPTLHPFQEELIDDLKRNKKSLVEWPVGLGKGVEKALLKTHVDKPFIFTEIVNCGEVGRIALTSFHKHHDEVVYIFANKQDILDLGEIANHPNNRFIDITENVILNEFYKYGHKGTAYVFAWVFSLKLFHDYDMSIPSYVIHFDSDVFFKKESISLLKHFITEGYDIVGPIRCYENNPSGIKVKPGTPDTVSTYFYAMRPRAIPEQYLDFTQLMAMFEGHNIGLDHDVMDFADAVTFHALEKATTHIRFLRPDMVGGQNDKGSKWNGYQCNLYMDAGSHLIHFGGAGSGCAYYKNPQNKNLDYGKWAVIRYALFAKLFFGIDIPVDDGSTQIDFNGRWVSGNYNKAIFDELQTFILTN